MFCLEVFAGSARLTASLRRSGFTDSVGLDSKLRAKLPAPVLCIDLMDDKSRPIVDSLLDSPNLCYIHFRPPVTPGRSLQHPDGLPDLEARDSALFRRVSRVNKLWNLTGEILRRAFQAGVLFSCENPVTSHLWASSGFAPLAIDLPLLRTTFDHCAYGGSRPKTSLLLHCVPLLSSLDQRCDGRHQHASWSPAVGALNRLDDLSYPNQLCRDWANLLVQQLVTLGAHAPPAELSQLDPDDLSAARAATNTQIGRRRPPLVPEFRSFVRLTGSPSDFPPAVLKTEWPLPPRLVATPAVAHLPPGSKVLGPSLSTRGEDKEEPNNCAVPSVPPCSRAVPSVPPPCSRAVPSVPPCSRAVPSVPSRAVSSVPCSRAVPSVHPCSRAVPSAPCSVPPCSRAVPSAPCRAVPSVPLAVSGAKPSVPAEPSVSPSSRAVPSVSVSAEPSVSPSSRAVPSVLPSSRAVPSVPDNAVLSVPSCSRAVPGEVEKLAKRLAVQPSAIDRSDMELLCRALPLEEPHQGQADCDGAFRAGMYIKGGIVGLHKSCRTHPWANKTISRYVLEQAATVGFSSHFTSAVVLVNTKTDPHKDQANMGEENIIIPVTCFENGGLWVESAGGTAFRFVGSERIPGVVINFNGKPVTIDAKHKYHATEPWVGDRIVISAYTLRNASSLRPHDASVLEGLGFLGLSPTAFSPASTAASTDALDPSGLVPSGKKLTPCASVAPAPDVRTITVGIPWTPEEFVAKACSSTHPGNLVSGVPTVLTEVIRKNAAESPSSLGQSRTATLRHWASRARELSCEESYFKSGLPSHCRKVLANKKLCLFKELLSECGHGDTTLVDEASQGFRLSGAIPDSHIFKAKRTTALMSTAELQSTSVKMREYILETCRSSGDPELDASTYRATQDEHDRGWIWGPVDPTTLPSNAILTRRFGIWQTSGDQRKCRPIDNYRESLVNLTTSANETITIHSSDTIAAGIAFAMKAHREAGHPQTLCMKAWDLRKAYKQLPLHETSLDESFLCVYDPGSGTAKIFGQYVLPFGARASVHGFCRISAGLWLIGVSGLRLHWYSYFDDFPTVEPEHTCPIARMGIDFLFQLLGWETSSEKDNPFSGICKVLGLEYNLEETKLGTLIIKNTAKRIEDVSAEIDRALEENFLSSKDGERLRGRLNFMESQLFGKLSQQAFRGLSRHVLAGGGKLSTASRVHLQFLKDRISKGKPRKVTTSLEDTMHIFVDACHEPGAPQPAGLGGNLINSSGQFLEYFSEMLDEQILSSINVRSSGNPIFELECLAILCALHLWHPRVAGRHLIVYTDNNGALGSMIKGYSENPEGNAIVRLVHAMLDLSDCIVWFERVCSSSNVADEPSRGVLRSAWGERRRCDPAEIFSSALA